MRITQCGHYVITLAHKLCTALKHLCVGVQSVCVHEQNKHDGQPMSCKYITHLLDAKWLQVVHCKERRQEERERTPVAIVWRTWLQGPGKTMSTATRYCNTLGEHHMTTGTVPSYIITTTANNLNTSKSLYVSSLGNYKGTSCH